MKILYFDCPTGIAGDMIVKGLLDAGLPRKQLKAELAKLQLSKRRVQRNLSDILSLIKKSSLHPEIKKNACAIFNRLARAEAKVHHTTPNQVHFHEVGAIDAILDIVGACIGFHALRIDEIYCSPLNAGEGTVIHSHGILPVPAPAVVELLKGIPIYSSGIKRELVTPTGAAIVSTLATRFGPLPKMTVESIGTGLGSYRLKDQINGVRVFVGKKELQTEHDAVLQMECNLDDLDPKLYNKAIKSIMAAGAIDCWIGPILMKKGRQAITLSALCAPGKKDKVAEAIFINTTTLGLRTYLVSREKLQKSFRKAATKYGSIRIKEGRLGRELITAAPEYEDYRKLAAKHAIPARQVYLSAFKSAAASHRRSG